ncbi:MAG: hypothetical protein WC319_13025 [Candidatus Paceibacterota bacterium]|jgi:hypothetical protein
MRPLIEEQLNKKMDEIVSFCFNGNRIADRGMSVLGVKFVMNKTESLLHERLAHLYPQLADRVSSYQAARNCMTVYGVTMEDSTDYESPLEFFARMVDYMIDLEFLVGEAIELAEGDCVSKAFLYTFLTDLIPVTNQCLLLVDKAEKYDGNWMAFDRGIESFIILPE